MKVVVQRVLQSRVEVDGSTVGEIDKGLLLYVCFESHDQLATIDRCVDKISKLRIFEDEDKKMNLNIHQYSKRILSISQFTLSWDGKKGHRPSFDKSMAPNEAKLFYRKFNDRLEEIGLEVQKGLFGEEMKVISENDGPVTFFLDY